MATTFPKMRRFEGKVVLVTGASSGIGSAVARRFAQEGASVACVARSADTLKTFVDDLAKSTQSKVIALPCDVALESDNQRAVEAVMEAFGRLDIAVINAGVNKFAKLTEITNEVIDELLNTHVKGATWAYKHTIPAIAKSGRGGSIISMSSVDASFLNKSMADMGFAMYGASKAALNILMQYAAAEAASSGIRVNAVAPGAIKTGILPPGDMETWSGISKEEFDKNVGSMHILGRGGLPEEVASVCAFLASDEADFVTGSVYPVDGGYKLASA